MVVQYSGKKMGNFLGGGERDFFQLNGLHSLDARHAAARISHTVPTVIANYPTAHASEKSGIDS